MKPAAVALIALALGIGGLLTIGAAIEIVREPTCRDLNRDIEAEPGGDCFSGSIDRRALVGVLLVGSGLAAFGGTMAGFYASVRGRRGGLFGALAVVSVLFFVLAVAAARAG